MLRLHWQGCITTYITEKNLKIINKSAHLLNKNAERFLGVQASKNLSYNHKVKLPGRQLTLATNNKCLCNRNIHNSAPALLDFRGSNQRKEEMKNYIFSAVLGGICLAMFIFSLTMRSHEDYVIINPNSKNK